MKTSTTTITFLGAALGAAISALVLGCSDKDLGAVQPDGGNNGGSGGSVSGTGGIMSGGGTGGSGPGPVDGGVLPPDNGMCKSIARPSTAPLPHVKATGAKGTAVVQALTAIYAAQTPPLMPPATHTIPSLSCSSSECNFKLQNGSSLVDIKLDPASPLARNLYSALVAAGAEPCGGAIAPAPPPGGGGGSYLKLTSMTVRLNEAEFDDVSSYTHGWEPNVVATGAAAQAMVAAFSFAGINDCDPSSSVFMICNTRNGHPECGYQRRPYKKVGAYWYLDTCIGTGGMLPGDDLSNDQATKVWQAILGAAQAAGFKPNDIPLEQTNIINGHFFTFDGTTVRFFLIADHATPPMPPPMH